MSTALTGSNPVTTSVSLRAYNPASAGVPTLSDEYDPARPAFADRRLRKRARRERAEAERNQIRDMQNKIDELSRRKLALQKQGPKSPSSQDSGSSSGSSDRESSFLSSSGDERGPRVKTPRPACEISTYVPTPVAVSIPRPATSTAPHSTGAY